MPGAYLWGYDRENKVWVRLSVSDKGDLTPFLPLAEGWLYDQANNPAANQVIVDTGQMVAGYYDVEVYMYSTSTANHTVGVEHRNAANAANLYSHSASVRDTVPAFPFCLKKHSIGGNERIRVINYSGGVTGWVLATIIWRRIAT